MISGPVSLASHATALREAGSPGAARLVQGAAEAHERVGKRLNAYKTWDADRALQQAEALDGLIATGVDLGPLMGIPISVKDLFAVPGFPIFAGTDTEFSPKWNAPGPLVRRVLSQMGIVMGKTHTVEFAFGGLGVNAHWGTPVNPHSGSDGKRAPGGSSSGAGVSVAEGSALLALGTDTAGSVRVPASFCGVAGLKTTHGRWSTEGIIPLSPSLDTPGLLARTVADLAWGFAAIDTAQFRLTPPDDIAGLRIGVPDNFFWEDVDPAISEIVTRALSQLERAGAVLVPLNLPGSDQVYEIFRQGGLAAPELKAFLDRNFPERIARLDPVVRMRVEGADQISAPEYLNRRVALEQCGHAALSVFEVCDLVATPTVAIPPPLLEDIREPDAYGRANLLALRNTVIANLFGWSALTLPAGLDPRGLPVGLQLMAPPMAEERLLSAGQAVEMQIGTFCK